MSLNKYIDIVGIPDKLKYLISSVELSKGDAIQIIMSNYSFPLNSFVGITSFLCKLIRE